MPSFPERLLFALVVIGASAWFAWRIVTLACLVRMGKPEPNERFDNPAQRIIDMLLDVFAQRRVLRKPVVGALHLLVVWGFFVFAINTINHFGGTFIREFNILGSKHLADGYAAAADVFAVLVITGILGLAFRRHVLRPPSLTRPSYESVLVFAFIAGTMAAYLLDNAVQIALGAMPRPESHVVSLPLARALDGLSAGALALVAHLAWWCDGITHLVLIALLFIPTKHLHLLAGPVNILFKRSHPRGRLTKLDLEDEKAESFGVSKIEEFTWKQNLDLLACIECGRCQDFCPTHNTQKPLSPKKLIVDLKHHLLESVSAERPALIGGAVESDAIWACTTCAACVEHCPMTIEHVDKLVDMRRHLVLMESSFPGQADGAFRNMETAGNPWGFAPSDRGAWAKGLDVPVMSEKKRADVLYWVGCSGSYDDRCKKVSVALVKILQAAHVDFAILGEEERCHCESARRLGNEYLYQNAAQEVIETLKQYEFKKILTACPHCFNTFANEYPALGAEYPVIHHTTFIDELLKAGALKLHTNGAKHPVAFHDSCYLSRYNGILEAPRSVLEAAGRTPAHVAREGLKGFCCGAGGGRMWLEETIGERINITRVRELRDTGAKSLATACPFCMTMLTDGVKAIDGEGLEIKDIAEIVVETLAE